MINIVLYQPEIPQNTGNIMRTCVATGAKLHIIGPMGFKINDDSLRRAGMDYLINFEYDYYESYEEFKKKVDIKEVYFVTRYGNVPPSSFDFSHYEDDIYLMFGRESKGIPMEILKDNIEHCMRLPMKPHARSLNLSNCVAIMTYEVLRQQNYYGLSTFEAIKTEDYIKK